MGSIGRQREADIVPFKPNDATDVSVELNNIIGPGVNDNFDREGVADAYVGTEDISITENATRIDLTEGRLDDLDPASPDGRVSVNEDDIADHEARVTVLEEYIDGYISIETRLGLGGTEVITLAEAKATNLFFFSGYPLTSDQIIELPLVTSADEGLMIEIGSFMTNTASYYRKIGGSVMWQYTGAVGGPDTRIANQLTSGRVIAQVLESTTLGEYRWRAQIMDISTSFT